MQLRFADAEQTVALGGTAHFRFTLDDVGDRSAVAFTFAAAEAGFDPSWCNVTPAGRDEYHLTVHVPMQHALTTAQYLIRLDANDRTSGAHARADCRLNVHKPPLCVKFPKHGRHVEAHADRTVSVSIPIINCGRFEFDASLDIRHRHGEPLRVDNVDFTVGVGEATMDTTVHFTNNKTRVSAKDLTVSVKYDGMSEVVWRREQRPLSRVAAAAAVVVLIGGAAVAVGAATSKKTSHRVTLPSSPPTTSRAAASSSTASTTSAPLPPTSAAPRKTLTALTVTISPTEPGSVTLTATVNAPGDPTEPTGTVQFEDASGLIGTAGLQQSQAIYSTTLTPGEYDVTATYQGDANHLTSPGAAHLSIPKTATNTNLTAPDVVSCSTETFTVAVAPTQGSGSPTGSVTFAAVLQTASPTTDTTTPPTTNTIGLTDAQATWSPGLPTGNYIVTAIYNGDPLFAGSTSTGLPYTRNCIG